jgi:ubiquinone biosynthesis protein
LQQVQTQQHNQTKKLANAVLAGCSLLGAVLLLTSGWSITAAGLALVAVGFALKIN